VPETITLERSPAAASLIQLLRERRSVPQRQFDQNQKPDHAKVLEAIESARWAPNHRRTQPWRFYVLDDGRIARLGRQYSELLERKGSKPEIVAARRNEWGKAPGIVIITCTTPVDADEVTRREDYAACASAAQNMMLHLWAEGIASKWSTATVWDHEDFWPMLGHDAAPEGTQVVGFFFYGTPLALPPASRTKTAAEVTVDFRAG
jgi:nitroreductase